MDEDAHSKQRLWEILVEDTDIPKKLRKKMKKKIRKYLQGEYWESKNDRIKTLQMNLDIGELVTIICAAVFYEADNKATVPIHPVLNRISNNFEYLQDIAAIKCASEILEILDGTVFDLHRYDTLSISSKFEIEDSTRETIEALAAMEPMRCLPLPWSGYRNGGYYYHKTHVILGSRKSYSAPIAFDVLNKLQKISTSVGYFVWRYDSRGRIYNTGYKSNFQGADKERAEVTLSKKYFVNFLEE